MQLKNYQDRVLGDLGRFLDALAESRSYRNARLNHDDEMVCETARQYNFVQKAWTAATGRTDYPAHKDGLGEWMPDVYLKVPTGGGKTLLACCAIDRIQRQYLRRQCGLVLWVMPTSQIYRQTMQKLSDRSHPYRQMIDIASGGRTLIRERGKPLKPADINGNLVVMLLMLPAANRQSRETLRMFRDAGGYDAFFPDSDDYDAHAALLAQIPNLDIFKGGGIFAPIVKSSLGNVIKTHRPLMIVDEGQKAYSPNARDTLRGFNPAFMLELSATPPKGTSIVAQATGKELDEEEMIKLDIHLANTATPNWKDTVLAMMNKRAELERTAEQYRQNSNRYIRPIALIQAERTGRDQREAGYVHAEDVRQFLVAQTGVRPEHVAIKSSEKDDIEGMDLLSEECAVRYIITKAALQEGWDCAFAYCLAVLTNPSSPVAMAQLVGRVLRQPGASKTKIPALDECYVFTRHKTADDIIGAVKKELENEGLGDLAGRVAVSENNAPEKTKTEASRIRSEFARFDGRIYLPQFVMVQNDKVRPLNYAADILANIEWEDIRPKGLAEINLGDSAPFRGVKIGLPRRQITEDETAAEYAAGGIEPDPVFMTRQLVDVVPNAWRAHEITRDILRFFEERDGVQKTADNFIYIIEQSRRLLAEHRDELAEKTFRRLMDENRLHFVLLTGKEGVRIPPGEIQIESPFLTRSSGAQLQRSLFFPVADDYNDLEKAVAFYLDAHENLLWWYRNRARADYHIQGWKRHKIYPDYIAAKAGESGMTDKVAVLETKGAHLTNDDTKYKESVFNLCNDFCKSLTVRDLEKERVGWRELGLNFEDRTFLFRVVHQKEWQTVINGIFA